MCLRRKLSKNVYRLTNARSIMAILGEYEAPLFCCCRWRLRSRSWCYSNTAGKLPKHSDVQHDNLNDISIYRICSVRNEKTMRLLKISYQNIWKRFLTYSQSYTTVWIMKETSTKRLQMQLKIQMCGHYASAWSSSTRCCRIIVSCETTSQTA